MQRGIVSGVSSMQPYCQHITELREDAARRQLWGDAVMSCWGLLPLSWRRGGEGLLDHHSSAASVVRSFRRTTDGYAM